MSESDDVPKVKTPAQEFGEEIRLARLAKGWTQTQLAEELWCQQPIVSKVERGEQLASAVFAEQCDRVFGTPGTYARMRQKAADASNPIWFIPFLEQERQARAIRDYAPTLVAGILQTPEYTEAVYRSARPQDSAAAIKKWVEDRMRRREVLDRPKPPSLWVILHESALWAGMGGHDVMRGQLQHLVSVSEHPHITIQVFPITGSPPRATPLGADPFKGMAESAGR
ncbi:Scr1 family TA system antitoxin-like transcriptional regulator [Streptomyces luteireticuli]|uniref:helix-turn-helix domain-containing protein n=1 Tax=Streptomyces luteireticuli TaxID=173858 RepID=UPI00355769EE